MMIGVLHVDVFLPSAQSLKDKRSALDGLTGQLRHRFNVAVAQLNADEKWQRATVGIAAIGDDRPYVEGLLRQVTGWLRQQRAVELVRVEQEIQ